MQAYGDCGSARKSMEVGGSPQIGFQKAGSFRWIYGSSHYFNETCKYLDERSHQLVRKKKIRSIYIKKITSRLVKNMEIVWRHGGVLSRTMFFFLGQNTRKVHVHKFGKKTGQSTRYRKIRAKVCQLSRVARVACMCNTTIYTWEGEPEVIS